VSTQIDPNTKPTPAVVDAEALGAAFSGSLKEALAPLIAQVQTQPNTKQKSALEQKLDQLLAKEGADSERIAEVLEILEAAKSDMNQRQNQDMHQLLKSERDARCIQAIQQAIQGYAASDEDIADTSELIEKRVVEDFNNQPEFAAAREKYSRGLIDFKVINDLVKRHVDRRAKIRGTDKQAGGVAGGAKTSASPPPASGDGGTAKKEDLVGPQRDLYDSHYSMLVRANVKAEDAHKEAMAAALRRKHK